MPDVWINLAHVHFAQGNFALAVKMVPFVIPCSQVGFIFMFLIFYNLHFNLLIYAVSELLEEILL